MAENISQTPSAQQAAETTPEASLTVSEIIALQDKIVEKIRTCYDPEIPVNIYDLGLIYEVKVEPSGHAYVKINLTSPGPGRQGREGRSGLGSALGQGPDVGSRQTAAWFSVITVSSLARRPRCPMSVVSCQLFVACRILRVDGSGSSVDSQSTEQYLHRTTDNRQLATDDEPLCHNSPNPLWLITTFPRALR